jgi:hypothetical protein
MESITPYLPAAWFLLYFVALWLLVTAAVAHMSGWASLVRLYRAGGPVAGDSFRFASGSIGRRYFPVYYRGCLFVTLATEGLYMSVFGPFRFQSPPLNILWSQIAEVTERRALFNTYYLITIRDHWARLSLWGKCGRRAYEIYAGRVATADKHPPKDVGVTGGAK